MLFLQSCDRRPGAAAIPGSEAYIRNSNPSSSFAALNHIYGSSHKRLINISLYRDLLWLTVNPTVPPGQCSSFCTTISDSESLIAVSAAAGSSPSPVVIINIENQFVLVQIELYRLIHMLVLNIIYTEQRDDFICQTPVINLSGLIYFELQESNRLASGLNSCTVNALRRIWGFAAM